MGPQVGADLTALAVTALGYGIGHLTCAQTQSPVAMQAAPHCHQFTATVFPTLVAWGASRLLQGSRRLLCTSIQGSSFGIDALLIAAVQILKSACQ